MSLKAAGAPGLPGLVTYYRSREDLPRRALPNVNRRGLCRTWNILNLVYHNVPISWSAAGYLVRSSLSRSIPTCCIDSNQSRSGSYPSRSDKQAPGSKNHLLWLKCDIGLQTVPLSYANDQLRTRKLVGHCLDHRSSSADKVPSVKCPFLGMSACR